MCIAIPARCRSPRRQRGGGALRRTLEVSLLLLQDEVAVGDFLILQARAFAVEKIAPNRRAGIYRLFDEFVGATSDKAA